MDELKNILYISYDGMTDPLGQSQVLPYICGLSALGFSFTLISCEKPQAFAEKKEIIEKICKENNIDWRPLPYTKSPPIFSTIKDIYAIKKLAYSLQAQKNFSIIHCRGYISAMVGLWMKEKFNTKFLFDMRGFWANEKVDAGAWKLSNPLFKLVYDFFKKKEIAYFQNADYTISLTEAGKNEIHSWQQIKNNPIPIQVIPCCADTALFDYQKTTIAAQKILQDKLGITENDFVVSYLGSIGTWYMLDEMLGFFAVFLKKKNNAKFLFITGDEHEKIKATAAEKNIPIDKIIIQKANRTEVPLYISLSAFSLFFIRPTYSKIASSPTKQAELMAMGVPIICNDGVGDTGSLVQKYASGVALQSFDADSYQRAIDQLLATNYDKETLRKGAIDFFDLTKGIEKYHTVYQKILQ
jgi:glycosyltransferase involved in cell wall biosynthesis